MENPIKAEETVYDLVYIKEMLEKGNFAPEIKATRSYDGSEDKYITFRFPVARNYDELEIIGTKPQDLEKIASSNIFKYRGVSNYEAIWSSELKCIECRLHFPNITPNPRFIMRTVSKYFPNEGGCINGGESDENINCVIFSSDKVCASIGYATTEFSLLARFKEGIRFSRVTMKIENVSVKTEDDARNILEKISDSLFFQIETLYNLTITLEPRRLSMVERRRQHNLRHNTTDVDLQNLHLNYEYDKVPMSLYWFSQSSNTSPIFRYFALYQVLEYYFPIYASMNIKTKIQNLVKDPKFNINRDSDVARLLNLMKSNNINSIGDEREQLCLTLGSITSGDDLIAFIKENKYLNDYYNSNDSKKFGSKARLNDAKGILEQFAERIYDIRCRIVHNKASETVNKILPMTKEVDYLVNEIEVLRFFAHKAIIANSRPFSLG